MKYIWLILLSKIAIIFLFPLSGDEAYFISSWSKSFEAGYYLHPPIIGWILYLMSYIDDSVWFYRLISFFTSIVMAIVIYRTARLYLDKERSELLAVLFFVSPISILMSLITNDIVLALFGTLGAYFFIKSFEVKRYFSYLVLSGVFLGLAFLSKYFAVFLGAGLALFAFMQHGLKGARYVLIATTFMAPFIAQNLYFNYNSCWNNILFNFFARTANNGFSIENLMRYIGFVLYFVSPWGIYYLFKNSHYIRNCKLYNIVKYLLIVPFIVFLFVSMKNEVGLHWLLLFSLPLFLLFCGLNTKELKNMIRYNYFFSLVHIVVLLSLSLIPSDYFKENPQYKNIIALKEPQKICEILPDENILYTTGYTTSAVIGYHCDKEFHILLDLSKYGRQDDKYFDVRTIQNKEITLFTIKKSEMKQLNKYFSTVFEEVKKIGESEFYLYRLSGFDYERYKTDILTKQNELYYNIPDWLPCGECYFKERYFE